jgi:hypothetical protein
MKGQRRHESPDLGDAIVRMMRGLVFRAAEGDQEAVEQLQRIAGLAPAALQLGVEDAHDAGYSWTQLGDVLGTSRQNAQQLAERAAGVRLGAGHVLVPGHNRRTCTSCNTPKN